MSEKVNNDWTPEEKKSLRDSVRMLAIFLTVVAITAIIMAFVTANGVGIGQ